MTVNTGTRPMSDTTMCVEICCLTEPLGFWMTPASVPLDERLAV